MFITPLNTRSKRVFQAIVEAHIESAAPVSSQAITNRLHARLSPATIRNVMAELNELGLIWQPHTSAGRIPTDKGYRYYIDALLEPEQLTAQEKEFIASGCSLQNKALDRLLTQILRILANFSGYTALAFSSGLRKILCKRLELVRLHSARVLVVLISQAGLVKTHIVQMPDEVGQQELAQITKIINNELVGLSLDEIKERLALRLLATKDAFFHLLKKANEILDLFFAGFDTERLYLEGASYILEQPEFQNTQKLQAILRAFEEEQSLLEILKDDLSPDGIKVHIGRENPCENFQECSLVISNFKFKNRNMGTLGIIGPRRMSYARVISTVSYMAQVLSERMVDY